MPKLLIDATIPQIKKHFSKHFEITEYSNDEELRLLLPNQDALVCRTHTIIDSKILQNNQLSVIATASSGRDHILHSDSLSIPILDGRGANAWAVSDYILSVLAHLKVLPHQSIGIIGYGPVGQTVSKRLTALNYSIKVYDPWVEIPVHLQANAQEIFECQVILIHCNHHQMSPYPSHHLLNAECFKKLSSDTIVINGARGSIVDEEALLNSRWEGQYCTDVYQQEPHINPDIIHRASICTPHIAGHSVEAKIRIIDIISNELHAFFGIKTSFQNTVERKIIPKESWQTAILNEYDPISETKLIKADPRAENFVYLRKKHLRHELDLK